MLAAGVGMGVGHAVVGKMLGGGGGHGGGEGQSGQAPQEGQQQQQMAPMEQAQPQIEENYGQQDPCANFNTNFMSCLNQQADGITACQGYMDMLVSCQKDHSQNF